MGSVGSVQFQIVPCFSLYLFSRSIGSLQCLVNVNCKVLICGTCHFQSSSLFFVCFGFLCLQVSAATATATAAKSLQSCLILCDPRDGSSPGSPVPGILQARTLEWVAISFSSA